MANRRDAGTQTPITDTPADAGQASITSTPPALTPATPSAAPPPALTAPVQPVQSAAGDTPGSTPESGGTSSDRQQTGSLLDEGAQATTAAEAAVVASELSPEILASGTLAQLPSRAGVRADNTYDPKHPAAVQAMRERRAFLGVDDDDKPVADPDKQVISIDGETAGERRERLLRGAPASAPAGGRSGEGAVTDEGGVTPRAVTALTPDVKPPRASAGQAALNVVETLPHGITIEQGKAVIPIVHDEARTGEPVDIYEAQAAGRTFGGGLPVGTQLVIEDGQALIMPTEPRATDPAVQEQAAQLASEANRLAQDAVPLQRTAQPTGPAAAPTEPGANETGDTSQT